MSEREFQHELNDELLSAYLDGELSPDERAAIEARIADDPEARKMLHQLRSVSQDVQSLPLRSVGRDLSPEILRRVEAIKPMASETLAGRAPTKPFGAIPKPTIFQTRRSWVWASLALAAGLLIMVLQPGGDANKQLADVAQHDGATTEADRKLKELPAVVANEPASTSAADPAQIANNNYSTPPAVMPSASPEGAIAGAPQSPVRQTSDIAALDAVGKIVTNGQVAASPPMPTAAPQLPASSAPADGVADTKLFAGRLGGAGPASPLPGKAADKPLYSAATPAPPAPLAGVEGGGGQGVGGTARFSGVNAGDFGAAPAEAAASSTAGIAMKEAMRASKDAAYKWEEPRPQVVVHILTKPESFQQKSFEKLLASHGIVMEAEHDAAKNESENNNLGRDAKPAETETFAKKAKIAPTGGEADFDYVLVDAPKTTIVSCLTALQKDAENYVGVMVDEPAVTARDRANGRDANGSVDKKLTSDLSQFNRGATPQIQKVPAGSARFYARGAGDAPRSKVAADGKEYFDTPADKQKKSPVEEAKQLRQEKQATVAEARARRLTIAAPEQQKLEKREERSDVSGTPTIADSLEDRHVQRELKTAGAATSTEGNLQVLFVIELNHEAAASPSTEKAQK